MSRAELGVHGLRSWGRNLSRKVRETRSSSSQKRSEHCSVSTPFVTLCMFLSQVLDPDHSCRAAVARLIVWLAVNHRKPCSPDTNTSCVPVSVQRDHHPPTPAASC